MHLGFLFILLWVVFSTRRIALVSLQTDESLLSPANGSLSTKDVIAGTIVSVSCEAGFTLFGNETLLCQDDGAWNGSQLGHVRIGTCS